MPTEPRRLTSDEHPTANRLLGAVHCERTSDGDAATELFVIGRREIDANPVFVGSGQGRFEAAPWGLPIPALRGVGRLARASLTPVATINHMLLRGGCVGIAQIEVRQQALIRWPESQFHDSDPGRAQLPKGTGP